MATLAEEIGCQPSLFAAAPRVQPVPEEVCYWSTISQGRNGFFALSGALIGFGRGAPGGPLDIEWYRGGWAHRSSYGELREADLVFGCDIFADLLFMRDRAVFRLDGETGDCIHVADSAEAFAAFTTHEAAELLGGNLARKHFAGRFLDVDPVRLLPSAPFVTAGGDHHSFLEVPLTVALRRKATLKRKLTGVSDGAVIDLTFWHEDIH